MTPAEAYERRGRALRTTRTYLRKVTRWLHTDLPIDPAYWDVLEEALGAAHEILEALPDDFFETTQAADFFGLGGGPVNMSDTAQEHVEKIVALLADRRKTAKRNRRIALLEQVDGRSEEEAAAFLAKAADMRRGR